MIRAQYYNYILFYRVHHTWRSLQPLLQHSCNVHDHLLMAKAFSLQLDNTALN